MALKRHIKDNHRQFPCEHCGNIMKNFKKYRSEAFSTFPSRGCGFTFLRLQLHLFLVMMVVLVLSYFARLARLKIPPRLSVLN
jgi:hypothetical protein